MLFRVYLWEQPAMHSRKAFLLVHQSSCQQSPSFYSTFATISIYQNQCYEDMATMVKTFLLILRRDSHSKVVIYVTYCSCYHLYSTASLTDTAPHQFACKAARPGKRINNAPFNVALSSARANHLDQLIVRTRQMRSISRSTYFTKFNYLCIFTLA